MPVTLLSFNSEFVVLSLVLPEYLLQIQNLISFDIPVYASIYYQVLILFLVLQ